MLDQKPCVIAIDVSGSMQQEMLERGALAAVRVMHALDAGSKIRLMAFDSQVRLDEEVNLGVPGSLSYQLGRMRQLGGGGTNCSGVFEKLDADAPLVFVISDCLFPMPACQHPRTIWLDVSDGGAPAPAFGIRVPVK